VGVFPPADYVNDLHRRRRTAASISVVPDGGWAKRVMPARRDRISFLPSKRGLMILEDQIRVKIFGGRYNLYLIIPELPGNNLLD